MNDLKHVVSTALKVARLVYYRNQMENVRGVEYPCFQLYPCFLSFFFGSKSNVFLLQSYLATILFRSKIAAKYRILPNSTNTPAPQIPNWIFIHPYIQTKQWKIASQHSCTAPYSLSIFLKAVCNMYLSVQQSRCSFRHFSEHLETGRHIVFLSPLFFCTK